MEVIAARRAEDIATTGAALVARWLGERPASTLLAAMGESPLGIYGELAGMRAAATLDTSRLRVAQLDAYLGIGLDDPRSLGAWLDGTVVAPLAIPAERVIRLPGDAADPDAVCRAYDAAIAAVGGIDVAVLGLGPNGHLGFNEPPSGREAPTRVVDLAQASLESNARYWGERSAVPTRALTAGMPILLGARHVLLVVAGERKRTILRRVLEGPIDADVPASWLRTVPGTVVVADEAALGVEAYRAGEPERSGAAT